MKNPRRSSAAENHRVILGGLIPLTATEATPARGEEVVLAWQFGGESSGPLPQWRCLKLANISNAHMREGPWHAGGSHRAAQTCVSDIDLDINVHIRKRR